METMGTTTSPWVELMAKLGPEFAKRCAAHDEDDSFVAENYTALKEHGVFAAGVPSELGGGGASHAELCAMIRELAHHCSSTALAFSMHTHPVAAQAYLWRAGNKAPEALLRRVAAEKLVIATSGGLRTGWRARASSRRSTAASVSPLARSSAAEARAPISCSRPESTTIRRTARPSSTSPCRSRRRA